LKSKYLETGNANLRAACVILTRVKQRAPKTLNRVNNNDDDGGGGGDDDDVNNNNNRSEKEC